MDLRCEGAAPSEPSQGPAIPAQELVSKQGQRLRDAKELHGSSIRVEGRPIKGNLFGRRKDCSQRPPVIGLLHAK
ncbi:hypothetical protein PG984_005957 [Apiospora sp. TS-2023a]